MMDLSRTEYVVIKSSKRVEKLLHVFVLITLVFGTFFYDFIDQRLGFSFIDELQTLLLLCLTFLFGQKKLFREFYLFLLVSFFYLVKSVLFPNNVLPAVFVDFVIQLKPFIAFYGAFILYRPFTNKHRDYIKHLCLILAICIFPIALNTEITEYFFGHVSRLATCFELLSMYYLFLSKQTKHDIKISCIMAACALLTLRSKAFGFVSIYILMMLFAPKLLDRKHVKKTKLFFLGIITISASLYLAWDKINFYFIEGASREDDMFARPALYYYGVSILNNYPLFGTGLGTYATFASAKYYSPIYTIYDLRYVNGLSDDPNIGGGFISDTFFPELVQFGYVGIFLFFCFWYKRYSQIRLSLKGNKINYLLGISILIFFFIESVGDSTFTQNRGFTAMLLLGFICSSKKS